MPKPLDPSKVYEGQPCRYGHAGVRWKSTKACVECGRIHAAAYQEALMETDPEHKRELDRASYYRHREKYLPRKAERMRHARKK